MPDITAFRNEHRWLSNFWPANITVSWGAYPSVEHAYVAAKCANVRDRVGIEKLTAGQVKRYGRNIRVREDWNNVRLSMMHEAVLAKFTQNVELRQKLLATGEVQLIEGNTWGDTFWGVYYGHGHNHLGEILMTVRRNLRDEGV